MITISHVLIGGAIGVLAQHPVGALIGGVASHFVADMTPHLDVSPSAPRKDGKLIWTPQIWAQAFLDTGIAALIVLSLWYQSGEFPVLTPFVIGSFGGFLPDLLDNVPFWNRYVRALPGGRYFHSFHEWTHDIWQSRFPMTHYAWLGVLTQLIAISIAVLVLKKYGI